MKKKLIITVIGIGLLSGAGITQAADEPTTNSLTFTATVTEASCTMTLPEGGTISLGNIPNSSLATKGTQSAAKTFQIKVKCPNPPEVSEKIALTFSGSPNQTVNELLALTDGEAPVTDVGVRFFDDNNNQHKPLKLSEPSVGKSGTTTDTSYNFSAALENASGNIPAAGTLTGNAMVNIEFITN